MRVMVLVKATEDSEKGEYAGREEEFAAMGRYNEELLRAGIMLAGEGLTPSSQGRRLDFGDDGGSRVIDGPFAETKELVGGFWIWQVSSMDEAVEWLKRAPFKGTAVELRRVQEAAGFEGQIPREIIDAGSRLREGSAQQRTQYRDAAAQRAAVREHPHASDPRGTPRCPEAFSNPGPPSSPPIRKARTVRPGRPGPLVPYGCRS